MFQQRIPQCKNPGFSLRRTWNRHSELEKTEASRGSQNLHYTKTHTRSSLTSTIWVTPFYRPLTRPPATSTADTAHTPPRMGLRLRTVRPPARGHRAGEWLSVRANRGSGRPCSSVTSHWLRSTLLKVYRKKIKNEKLETYEEKMQNFISY